MSSLTHDMIPITIIKLLRENGVSAKIETSVDEDQPDIPVAFPLLQYKITVPDGPEFVIRDKDICVIRRVRSSPRNFVESYVDYEEFIPMGSTVKILGELAKVV